MTSIRVPPDLLKDLHRAAPPGVSLGALLDWMVEGLGGPEMIRETLLMARRRETARAKVARLRNRGHRSVVMDPGQQVLLAEATADHVRRLERSGDRRVDAQERVMVLIPTRKDPHRVAGKRSTIRRERGGDPSE